MNFGAAAPGGFASAAAANPFMLSGFAGAGAGRLGLLAPGAAAGMEPFAAGQAGFLGGAAHGGLGLGHGGGVPHLPRKKQTSGNKASQQRYRCDAQCRARPAARGRTVVAFEPRALLARVRPGSANRALCTCVAFPLPLSRRPRTAATADAAAARPRERKKARFHELEVTLAEMQQRLEHLQALQQQNHVLEVGAGC